MTDIYNSIAAKLNYELDTKNTIRDAIITKGVQVPEKTPFREYGNKILSIVTDGGFFGTLTPNENIWSGDESFSMLSDVVLANNFSIDDFHVSENIASIEKIDNLNFKVVFKEPLQLNSKIEIQTKETAYLNKNGECNKWSKKIFLPSWEDYQDDFRHMTAMFENPVKTDSWNSGVVKFVDSNGYDRAWSANSEGQIGFDYYPTSPIMFYQRDGSISQFWWSRCEHLSMPFVKFRGAWYQPYNNSAPNTEAEFFVFDSSYHIYIHGLKFPTTTGTNKLYNATTYLCDAEHPKVSAYRKNFIWKQYEIIYDDFDFKYAEKRNEEMYAKGTIEDFVGNYYLDKFADVGERPEYAQIINGVKCDGDCSYIQYNKIWNPVFPIWFLGANNAITEVNYIGSHGDLYIALNGKNSYPTKFGSRDGSQYYAHIRQVKLTDMNNRKAIQIIWGGASVYSGAIKTWWELWFFDNQNNVDEDGNPYPNDAMIYCKQNGSDSSTYAFLNQIPYNKLNTGEYVSFYWNLQEKKYDIVYDKYRPK